MPTLTPRLGGWRSDDGYSFTIGTGRRSNRMVGELVPPAGQRIFLAGSKHDTSAALLEWAEREICKHRAGEGV